MAVELATAYVNLQASARGIGQSISNELGAPLGAAGLVGGQAIATNVNKGFNAQAVGATAGKALAVGIGVGVAGGAALFKIGDTFDEAFDAIRVGTGATGEVLEGLQEDFKEVFKSVPTDAATAGNAIADLNTRLGISGEPLQDLATQFLELSRLTGTDLQQNIAGLTRVFGDWEIPVEQSAEALDQVFLAAQSSGIGLDQLQTSVVQFGAPLRNLGFGFEESLALLSQFDKAGVNTSTVFGGLRQGIGKLAKEGEDIPETFRRIVSEIEAIGPGTEATGLAIELFGQRAGPDLADAIAGGKFAIDDILAAITDGDDTILSAAEDTESFGEKWQKLVNTTLVALEPAATAVFEAVGSAVESLTPFIETAAEKFAGLVAFFQENSGLAKALIAGIAGLGAALTGLFVVGKVVGIFTALAGAIGKVVGIFKVVIGVVKLFSAVLLANPIFLIIGAIVALGVALFAAYKRFEGFRNVVDAVGRFIKGVFLGALNAIRNWWDTNGEKIIDAAKAVWEGIKSGAETVGRILGDVFSAVASFVTGTLVPVFQQIAEVVGTVFGVIGDVIGFVWNNIVSPIFQLYVAYIQNVLVPVFKVLWEIVKVAFGIISAVISAAWAVIQPVLRAAWWFIRNVLVPVFQRIWDVVSTVFSAVAGAIKAAWHNVIEPIFNAVRDFIVDTLIPRFQEFRERVEAVWDRVKQAIGRAWKVIEQRFEDLKRGIQVVKDFIGDRIDDIVGFFSGIRDRISDAFSTIADVIREPFRKAFNFIVRAWNNTIGGLSIPDLPGVPGRGISIPTLSEFHTGGIIPGRRGEEVPILGLAGERVLSLQQTRDYDANTDSGGVTINATYNQVEREPSPEDLVRKLRRTRLGAVA